MLEKRISSDVVLVSDLTRLSRNTKDLFFFLQLEKYGANIKILKESWLDTTTAQGNLMFMLMAGIGQFERDLTSHRTKEELEAARARGKKGGWKEKLDANQSQAVVSLYHQKK